MNQTTRGWWTWGLRILITVVGGGFLASKLNWGDFVRILNGAEAGWMGWAMLTYGGIVLVSILRWHILLEVAGAAVGWARTAQLIFSGLFFNSVLPGVMGGDVMRAYWAARDAPQARAAAVVSILLERVLGLSATVLVGAFLILPRWRELNDHPVTHAGATAFLIVAGFLGVILFCLVSPRASRWLGGHEVKGWRKVAAEGAQACHICLTHPLGAGVGLALSVVSQLLLVGLFFSVSRAVHLEANFWQLASVLPMVVMVTVVPITWNGLGLREAAFATFLGVFGVAPAQSVAISLGGFAVILIWNLLGGVVYLLTGTGKVER